MYIWYLVYSDCLDDSVHLASTKRDPLGYCVTLPTVIVPYVS